MNRTLSLLTPSGHLTLGNLLGALRPMAAGQGDADCFYGIADLHAMTTPHDPARLRTLVRETATLLLAVGLDESTLFVQSRVPAHAQLAYLLECTASTGELNRMIQFKEKGRGVDSTRVSLYTYPALMAADILLYRPAAGAGRRRPAPARRAHPRPRDPLQPHLRRRSSRSPRSPSPAAGARVMAAERPDPQDGQVGPPTPRASSTCSTRPDVVRRKVARAVTDSDTGPDAVRADAGQARRDQPARHPGGVRRLGRRRSRRTAP